MESSSHHNASHHINSIHHRSGATVVHDSPTLPRFTYGVKGEGTYATICSIKRHRKGIRDEMMGALEREPERHGIKVLLAGASKLSKKDSVMSSNPVKPSSKPMS
jgi:hypothetical protein